MISTRIEIITPEKAKEYLARNVNNYRKLNMDVVKSYADDMKSGHWILNGEAIQFGENGELLNGQHRLNAIVMSNMAVSMIVIDGIPETNFYDLGLRRTPSQMASNEGIKNASLAMAVSNIMLYKFSPRKASSGIILEYCNNHPEIQKAMQCTNVGSHKAPIARKAPIVAVINCLLKLKQIDEETASKFCRIVNSGNITEDLDRPASPALVFKRQIDGLHGTGGKTTQKYLAEISYRAIMDFKNKNQRIKNYPDTPVMVIGLIDEANKKEEKKS